MDWMDRMDKVVHSVHDGIILIEIEMLGSKLRG